MARRSHSSRKKPRTHPRGVLSVHNSGYGFVKTSEGEFFIPESKMGSAFDGDLVEVAPLPTQGSSGKKGAAGPSSRMRAQAGECPAARIVSVVHRGHDTVIGRYEVAEPFGVVVPEDQRIHHDIFTMRADNPDIPDGALVRVRMRTFPSRYEAATGVIEEVLGFPEDCDVGIDLIIARHKLETEFSEGSYAQAAASAVDVEGALRDGYRDIRERFVVTIDPRDARDFDDALSFTRLARKGAADTEGACAKAIWRLGIHIADVSHYVGWATSLDLDARRRATSVYLADRVVPMLPEALSCDVCSLKPGKPRRTMTVDVYLSEDATVCSVDMYPSLIVSKRRLSYEEADELLHHGEDQRDSDSAELADMLRGISRIAKRLSAMRAARGGLDFKTVEAKAVLDSEGHPVGIALRKKTDATELVEESMILANELVAKKLETARIPSIFRVHERPAADALSGLVPVFQEFSWWARVDAVAFCLGDPRALSQVLSECAGRAEEELVSTLLLRSMKRAVYAARCEGHYGLASAAYAHFTSPIRRYPDLVAHRMLKACLFGKPDDFDAQTAAMPWLAEHASDRERVADAAARESQEYKIIEYLSGFLGQRFSATISGVATYGVYARLDCTAEGLVPVRFLGDDYFELDAVRYALVGADSGVVYRLGQRIEVVITQADPRSRTLAFKLA